MCSISCSAPWWQPARSPVTWRRCSTACRARQLSTCSLCGRAPQWLRAHRPAHRLSRAIAGTRGSALILNLAAAPERAVEMLDAVLDVVPEVLELLEGGFVPTVDAVEPNLVD